MKLHLPVSLRRAVMKVLAALALPLATTVASGSTWTDSIKEGSLGKTMYLGDSVSHGVNGDLSWRWDMHKIFSDNGIQYREVGVNSGSNGALDLNVNMMYGSSEWKNVHSADSSARAFQAAERKLTASGYTKLLGGTGIQHWLGQPEPDGWTGSKNDEVHVLSEGDRGVDTYFSLYGTNDLISEGQSNWHNYEKLGEEFLADYKTILETIKLDNPNARLVILEVPTWAATDSWLTQYEGDATREETLKHLVEEVNKVNAKLGEWADAEESVTLIHTSKGLVDVASSVPGEGVTSMFQSDHFHPGQQGDLIIAGNVAKQLGIAGRTAGQVRKAGTDFTLRKTEQFVSDAGEKGQNVTTEDGKLHFTAGTGNYTYNWDSSPAGGYTVEFKLDGGIGDGASGGWNTTDYFSVSMGNGTLGGTLNIDEAYIRWGNNILYSLDTSTGNLGDGSWDPIRIAYVKGNELQGLLTGFYVWLGDQLIGEGLSPFGSATNGLSITNSTADTVTLSGLYMDDNSWAPAAAGYVNGNPTIEAKEKTPVQDSFTGVTYESVYDNNGLNAAKEGTKITKDEEITVPSDSGEIGLLIFDDESKGEINVKLNSTASSTSEFELGTTKFDGIASLYLSGAGLFIEDGNFSGGGPTTIYINGAQLYFSCWQGTHDDVTNMTSDFVIGKGGSGKNGMTGPLAFSKNVATSGGLTLEEDSSIGFYDGNGNTNRVASMTFGGTVSGAGKNLELVAANKSADKDGGLILKNGGTLGSISSSGDGIAHLFLKITDAGTLTLEKGGKFGGKLIGDGKAGLAVNSGRLSIGTMEGKLSTLTLGGGATLDITQGNLVLDGALSFANGSRIKLNTNGQQITLNTAPLQAAALSRETTSPLTIELSQDFMGNAESGSITLFTKWDKNWNELFTVEVEFGQKTYEGLHIEDGKLVWTSVEVSDGVVNSFTRLSYTPVEQPVTAEGDSTKNLTGNQKFTVEMASYAACQFQYSAEATDGNLWLDFNNNTAMGLGENKIGAKTLLLTCTNGSNSIKGTVELWFENPLKDMEGLYIDGDYVRLHVNKAASYGNLDLHLNTPTWTSASENDCYSIRVASGITFATEGTLYAGKSAGSGYEDGARIELQGGTLTVGQVEGANLKVWGKGTATGTLNLTNGGTLSGTFAVQDALNLSIGGTLQVNTISGDTLTTLTLGANAGVDFQTGTLKATSLTLGGAASIKLKAASANGANLNIGSITFDDHKLTIQVDGWDDVKTTGYQLFAEGSFSTVRDSIQEQGWDKYFVFQDGEGNSLGEVELTSEGKLQLKAAPPSVADYTWTGSGTVTLGDSIEEPNDWNTTGDVNAEKTVTLEGRGTAVTVTVDGGSDDSTVNMKSLTVGKADTTATTYTFSAQGGTAQTLKVSEGMTINDSATFGEHVKVDAGSSTVAVNVGTTKFESGSTLTAGKLTITGEGTVVELSGAAASVNVKGTLALQISSANVVTGVNGEGGIELGVGTTLRLSSDVFASGNGSDNQHYAFVTGSGTVDIAIGTPQTGEWNNWFGYLFPSVAYKGAEVTLQLSNSTQLTLVGNLGDRLQNAKKVVIGNGSSVVSTTTGNNGADLFSMGEGHELHIQGTGTSNAGALVFGLAQTISWAFVLDGNATVSNTAAMTLTGELDTGSGKTTYTLTKKGSGTMELGSGFSTKASSSGTIAVTEGTLELSYTTNATTALQNHTVALSASATLKSGITGTVGTLSGTGNLDITGGTLTLGTANGATLSKLALGTGETAGNLTVSAGSFTLSGELSWGTGSVLSLAANGQTINLGEGASIFSDASADKQLTINLSSTFLGGEAGGNGSAQLFTDSIDEDWIQYFKFTVDGAAFGAGKYENLKLSSDGKLTWGTAEPTVDTYTWSGTGSVTLGDSIDVQGDWNDTGAVDATKSVVLNGTGEAVTVTVSGSEEQNPEVNVKALTVGETAGDTTAYTFSGTSNQKLTVEETLTLNAPTTFESTVSVTAKQLVVNAGESGAVNFVGGLELTNGTTAGGLTITKGNVTFSGGTVNIGAGSVSEQHSTIGKGASLTVESGVQLKSLGLTELEEGATLTLKTLGTKSGDAWDAKGENSIVWGDGTLIFDSITATSAADFNDGFLPGGGSYTLGELRLSGSHIATNSTRFQHVTKMVVESDSTLEMTANIFSATAHPEVHISGTGSTDVGAALVYTPASDKESGRQDHTHIVLDANATISNAGTIWFMGSLSALQDNEVDGVERHTLTKTGGGFFQVLATSTVTNVDFDVAGGRLLINQDNNDGNGIHSSTVTLSGGHLKVGGGGNDGDTTTLTLKALEGTTENSSIYAGSYNSKVFTLTLSDDTAKVEHSVVADLGYGSDAAVGASAAASHAFNLTKAGQATQKFKGKVNLGNIDVQGGKLEFALTGDGTAGAVSVATSSELAVKGSTLTISGLSGQGSVTGDGTLKLTAAPGSFDGTFSANLDYDKTSGTFSLKSFTGSKLTVTDGTLTLTDALTTGSRTVTLAEGGTLKLATGSVIDTLAGTGGTLDITGTVSVTSSTNFGLTGLKLSSGGKLEVGSSITSVGLGEITLAGAAELSLGGTSDLKLSGTWGGSSSDKLTLRFTSDFLQSIAGAESYQLVTGSATGWNDSHVTFADVEGYTVAWETDGTIKVTATAVDPDVPEGFVAWNKDATTTNSWSEGNWGDSNSTWDAAGSTKAYFSDEEGETITIDTTITADTVQVAQGNWTWKKGASGTLTVTNGITIDDKAELQLAMGSDTSPWLTVGQGKGISGTGSLVVTFTGDRGAKSFSTYILPLLATSGGETLAKLHIKSDGTQSSATALISITGSDTSALSHVGALWVDEGAGIQVSDKAFETSGTTTLHLNSEGTGTTGLFARGALHFTQNATVGWQTELEGNTVLTATASHTGTINELAGNSKNLTIGLSSSFTGDIKLGKASGIGELTVAHGSLILGFSESSTDKIAESVSGGFQLGDTTDELTYKFGTLTGEGNVTKGTTSATLELSGKEGGSTSFERDGGADASAFTGTIAEGITVSVTGGYWTWQSTSNGTTDATVDVGASGHVKLDGLTIDSTITSSGDLVLNEVKSSGASGSVTVSGGSLSLSGALSVGSLTSGIKVTSATSVTLSDSMSLIGKLAVASATNITIGKGVTLGGNGSSMDLSGVQNFEAMADEKGNKVASLSISLSGRGIADPQNEESVGYGEWALKLSYDQLSKLTALDGFSIELTDLGTETHYAFLDTTGWSVSDWANDANIKAFLEKVTVDGQSGKQLTLDEKGHLSLVDIVEDWTWDSGEGTWSSTSFEGRVQSSAEHDITFSATGASETAATITVEGDVSAKNITVGSNAKYTFTGGTSITATGTLDIGSGAEVNVDMNWTVTGETTLNNGSTLKLSDSTTGYTFSGGLTLDDGTLELAGTKTVTVGTSLSWKGNSTLKLSSSATGLNIVLTGVTLPTIGEEVSALKLELTTGFLDAVKSDNQLGYKLFTWEQDFSDRFALSIDGGASDGKYKNLHLRSDGTLFWGDITDLYWSDSTDSTGDTQLVWGTGGDTEWSTSAGTKGYAAWVESAKVHLGATTAVTVTLKDAEITAGTVGFTAANATGGYTFSSDAEGGSTALTVAGITNIDGNAKGVGVKATFGENVTVEVTGDFVSHDATSEYSFAEKLKVDGLLQLWNGATLELTKGGEVGTLDASWNRNAEIKLGGDLVIGSWNFNDNNANGGHHSSFTKTGDATEVFLEVHAVKDKNGRTDLAMGGVDSSCLSFGTGVGIRSNGSGSALTFVDNSANSHAFEVGGSFAAVNGGSMVFNVDATAGMNVEVGESSTITIGDGKTLTTSGLTGWKGEDGSMKYGTIKSADDETSSGTGTLKLTATSGEFGGTFSANLDYVGGTDGKFSLKNFTGKELTVTSGELTLETAEGATLSKLALRDGETAGKLTVSDGSFTLDGELSWGKGSVLTLGAAEQTIALGEGASIFSGASTSGKLTINLTETFMGGEAMGKGSVQLFQGSVSKDWIDNLTFTVNDTTSSDSYYKNLKLRNDGYLTWGDVTDLYWPGTSEDQATLTWGTGGGMEWSTSADRVGDEEWVPSANVHLGATTGVTVTLKDAEITAGTVGFTAANATGGYAFSSDAEGGSTTLTVAGITNNESSAVKATFGEGVNVHVTGNFTNHSTRSEFLFKEKLVVDGQLSLWGSPNDYSGASVMTLEKGAEIGDLEASWAARFVLGGDLVVKNWSYNNDGHWTWFEKLSTGETEIGDVYVDVQTTTQLTMRGHGESVFSFGDGVGIKSSGNGNVLTLSDKDGAPHDFAVGGSYAAVGGGHIIFNTNATAGMNVEVGTGSTITINEGKTLTTSGLTGWQGDGGMTYGTITGEGTLKVSTDSTEAQEFGGTISSNLEYNGTGVGSSLTLTQAFGGKSLTLNAGTLKLTAGGTISSLNGAGGALEVGGTVDVGSVTGSLTKLALGAGSTVHVGGTEAQTLTVGGLTWGKGAKLDLDSQLTIGLSGVTLTQPDAGNLLTIDLSSTVLDSLGSGKWQLFSDWSQVANWEQYIEFKVDGETVDSAKYGELGLDADGKLTWVAPEGVITWTDEDNNGALVWGTDSEWTVDGEGGQAYATDKDVVFQGEHDGTIEVTLADSTTVGKGMELKLAEGDDAQAYNFELGAEQALTVNETLTVGDGITAEFSGTGALTVSGGTTVKGTLAVSTSGAKNLGEVTLSDDASEFVVKNADSWDANTTVTGTGALVFEGLGDLTPTTVDALIKDGGTLGSVVLRGNTALTLSALGGIGKASKMVVEKGASLSLSDTRLLNSGQAPELHIAGTGATADGAALLYTSTNKGTSNAKLVLDGDATISNVNTVWFGGSITAGDVLGEDGASRKAVLTKKGAGDFEIYDGTFTDLEKISLLEGALTLTYDGGTRLSDTVVSLDGGELKLSKSGAGEDGNNNSAFTLKGLDGDSGEIWGEWGKGSSNAVTLTLDDEADHMTGADVVVAKSGYSEGERQKLNIIKEGTGVQTFSGAFTAGTVTLNGGGITLANGTGGNVDSFVLNDGTTLTLNSGAYTAGELSGADGKYGSVTGDGTLQLTAQSGSFEGEFSANLDYAGQAAEGTDQFSLKSFTGKKLTVTSGELTLTDELTTGERTVTLNGGTLKLANGGVIDTLAGTGGALDVTGMVSIGASTHSGLTSLTLAKDSNLDLTKLDSMTLGAVTVTDTATIAVGRNASSITLLTVSGLTGNLTIDLNGVSKENLDGLQLFSEGIDFAEQVGFTGVELGARDELTLNADNGQLSLKTVEEPITWNGTSKDTLTWKENGGENEWTIGEGGKATDFMNGDKVLFTDSGESENTVTLDATGATEAGKLKAASVTVEDGTWTFTGDELVVDESLEVGGTATFKNTTSAKTLSGSGDVTLSDGGSLTIQDTLTADETSGFTGGITLDNGTLTLGGEDNTLGEKLTLGAGGGTINGSITAELDGQNADAKLTLGTGTQNLSGSTAGEVSVGGMLTGADLTVGGLSGSGTLGGTVTVDGKGGTFAGTIAEPLELTVKSGTQSFSKNAKLSDVVLNGGTLKLAAGGTVTSLNGAGGALEVGGTVEVGSVTGSLTKLTLGDRATMHVGGTEAQTLTVGGFTWGKDATLEFDSQLTIALAEGALTQPGEGGQLTIDLSSDVLDSLGSGNWQLFSGWSGADWTQYFKFTIDGQEVDAGRYGGFGLDADGKLTWSEPLLSDLYWDASKDADGTLTWEGEDKEWSTSEDGTPNATWPSEEGATDGTSVHIAGEEEADYAVEMAGDVTAKDVEFNGGDYTFAEGEGKLTTEGDLTVGTDKKTTVDFGDKQLDVGGNLTAGDGSSLATTGDATVQGDFSVGNGGGATVGGVLDVFGNLATDEGSTLTAKGSAIVQGNFSVGKDSEATVVGMLNVGGDLTTDEGGKLTTKGDTSVAGGLTLGKDSTVTATGKLDVAGDVNVGSGTLTANGGGTWGSAQVAPGGSLSMKDTTVTGGVKMGNGSSVTMDGSTVNGELSVEGGKLTVGGKSTLGSVSGKLTGLEIADGGNLTVNGNGLAADTFTWGSGSTLGLGSGFSGTLNFGSMDGKDKLTLDLSSQFLDRLGADENSVKLFENWNESWGDKLEFTINGRTPEEFRDGYYGDLHIGDDGTLTWTTTRDKPYYESSTDNETADDGTKTEWNVSPGDNIYDSVGDYGQVIVDSNTNIDFSQENVEDSKGKEQWEVDGLTVHNLHGTNSNATLTITGGGEDKNGKVTLKNSYSSKETEGVTPGDELTYSGGITVENAALHINHEDTNPESKHHGAEWGTVMGGELNLSKGQGLFMDRGVLKLRNEANQLTDVTFTNNCDGQLVVDGGSATVSGDILLDAGEAVYETQRNHVHLENGGTLELVGGIGKEEAETKVGAGVTIGGDDASGSAVGMKGKVNMEKGSRISGLHLILENKDTVLTVGADNEPAAFSASNGPEGAPGTPESNADAEENTKFSIYGIQSNGGHLTGTQDMVINVRDWDHVFTGSMEGYKGTMTFTSRIERIEDLFRAQTPQQYFTQVTDGSSDWNMVVDSGARVTLDVLNSKGRNAGWEMGNVTLVAGSQTTLGFTFSSGGMSSASATGMSFGSFRVAEDAGLTLQAYGSAMPTNRVFVLGQMTGDGAVDLHWDGSEEAAMSNEVESNDNDELELKRNQLVGGAWLHVESAKIVHENNQIKLRMKMTTENLLAEAVQGIHQNATQGANAVWQLTDTVNNPKANEALNDPNSDTSKLSAEAQRLMSNGNKAELAKLLAASAGAGYTGYSAALGEDMHRQLTAIRNRTTSMGDEAAAGRDEDMPYWHAWLNAESSYRELDADDLAPGYRVNGWGGTFGVDADISRNTTLGLALTAMYNDLKCTGADSISGDMDTMYATAFLRHMRGRWMHTIVLSGGTADFKTHRTVMSGSGNYTADADTSGYSLGALYEIGYTTVLSKDSRRVMQYVFNVEARHNSIDGFTESGSDAGLVVDDMDSMTVTFGLGARLQSLFGGKVYNRSALFEARFLVKADAGDRRGEAATRFINGSYATNMVGAEVGAVGVELGAGITVPVGSTPYSGSFFIDGSLEFRQGWTSFDATLGYRISF